MGESVMPKVSVVIPVYNVKQYLYQCLDSVVNQTLKDIEIICINDGSEDGSLAILKEYAAKDKRIVVLNQNNYGANNARNKGLDIVKGEFLSFLDSDDFFELDMLEKSYRQCLKDKADICIYRVNCFHEQTKRYTSADFAFNKKYMPKHTPFSYKDMPCYIFNAFQNWLFNKLFKTEMIVGGGISFQDVRRTTDLFFSCISLVTAKKITVLNEVLAYYRIGTLTSNQATNHKAPLDFYKAFSALKTRLIEMEIFNEVEQSFVNHALDGCIHNLNSLKTSESFSMLYNKLKNGYFDDLNITGHPESYFYLPHKYYEYLEIQQTPLVEYLFKKLKTTLSELDNRKIPRRFDIISYKVGRLLTYIPRKLLSPWKNTVRKALGD